MTLTRAEPRLPHSPLNIGPPAVLPSPPLFVLYQGARLHSHLPASNFFGLTVDTSDGGSDMMDRTPHALRTPIEGQGLSAMGMGEGRTAEADMLHDLSKFDTSLSAMDQEHDFSLLSGDDLGLTLGLAAEEMIWSQN